MRGDLRREIYVWRLYGTADGKLVKTSPVLNLLAAQDAVKSLRKAGVPDVFHVPQPGKPGSLAARVFDVVNVETGDSVLEEFDKTL